jgi:hypothetical protein
MRPRVDGYDATAHVLLAVLRGRCDERSWNRLDDNHRVIATQLVAAGAITEDHGMLAPHDAVASAARGGAARPDLSPGPLCRPIG